MKKHILISFMAFLFFSNFSFAKDFELMFSTPSMTGLVCGKNTLLAQTQNFTTIDSGFNYSVQAFGEILSVGKVTFAYSPGVNFYRQKNKDSDDKAFQTGLSLGIGLFFNDWESFTSSGKETLPLSGPSVFLYPLYEFPIIRVGGKPYWDYKYAFEIGLNYVFKMFSVYPYFRGIGMLSELNKQSGFVFDGGILVGIYF